jgi:hypothetical protein
MFNKTLNIISKLIEDNLFNPQQGVSPQPWHVPRENIFGINETPDPGKMPRVFFTMGDLETDSTARMEAFIQQPDREVIRETIRPADFGFAREYTLEKRPLQPIIGVLSEKTDGTRVTLEEGDDFTVDYKIGGITFRDDTKDVDAFTVTYNTGKVAGQASTLLMMQPFSIGVSDDDNMNIEAICAIIIGVLEAYKEEILAEGSDVFDGINVATHLKPIDIQLFNKAQDENESNNKTIRLNYRISGMLRIARKITEEELRIIEKIYHPGIMVSERDVDLKIKILNDASGKTGKPSS